MCTLTEILLYIIKNKWIQQEIYHIYILTKTMEVKIQNIKNFMIIPKKINYIDITLIGHVQNLYPEIKKNDVKSKQN